MSPILKERIRIFKSDKKAYYSLIILSLLFIISLPAELFFNDKPLILSIDGKWHYPALKDYSIEQLGGKGDVPIVNFQSKELLNFLNGIEEKEIELDLFEDEEEDEEEETSTPINAQNIEKEKPKKHSYWMLFPPIKFDHKAKTYNRKASKEYLAAPYVKKDPDTKKDLKPASLDGHYLGTEAQGKDVLARIVYGFRLSMIFGIGIAFTSTIIGTILGGLQGYFGGLIDLIGQRLTEILGSIPRLFVLIILSAALTHTTNMSNFKHTLVLFVILNLTAWMGMAAYMRAEFLKARNLEYVKAAKALGVSDVQIMFKHILPNSLTPIVTLLPFEVTGGILALTSLDYLGLGVKYPAPSLGNLLSQGKNNLEALWIIVPTFIVLTITLTLLTFIGDGIRNAFDPRRK